MGHYSVHCSISKIAISRGECGIIPLLPTNMGSNQSYLSHMPCALPIFGEYDTYGRLENIIEDDNTRLLEEYFCLKIQVICDYLTRKMYEGTDSILDCKNFEELKSWDCTWVNKEVYEFVSTLNPEYSSMDMGDPGILELLGFKRVGESNDTRFKHLYEFNGKQIMSDGKWLHTSTGGSYYQVRELIEAFGIGEDKHWVIDKSMYQLWKYVSPKRVKELFQTIIISTKQGLNGFDLLYLKMDNPDFIQKPTNLVELYFDKMELFGDKLCEMQTMISNLYTASTDLGPNHSYLTPQDGDHKQHQKMLEKFSEINKQYIWDEDEA